MAPLSGLGLARNADLDAMKWTPRLPDDAVNTSLTRLTILREMVWLSSLAAGLIIIIYVGLGLLVDAVVDYLPDTVDGALERVVVDAADFGPVAEPTLPRVRRWQRELDDLAAAMPAPAPDGFTLHLIEDADTVNAVALPGGHVLLFTGLIDAAPGVDAVRFVLAHELGHFANRDHLRGLGRRLLLALAASLVLGSDNPVSPLVLAPAELLTLRHSRDQETAADAYAVRLLYRAYGSAEGAEAMMRTLAELDHRGTVDGFLSTHPLSAARAEHLRGLIDRLGAEPDTSEPAAP